MTQKRHALLALVCALCSADCRCPRQDPQRRHPPRRLRPDIPQAAKSFSRESFDQCWAHRALPDALLAQVLMAVTYPLGDSRGRALGESQSGPQGKGARGRVAAQRWDPSVKSLTVFPEVPRDDEREARLDAEEVGDAFLAQQRTCSHTAQALRQKAQARKGALKDSEQQKVVTAQENNRRSSRSSDQSRSPCTCRRNQPDRVVCTAPGLPFIPPYLILPPPDTSPEGPCLALPLA